MSNQDSKTNDLEQYLSGKDKLSSAYQQSSDEEPSSILNQTILDASKHAIRKKPKIAYSPFSSNWAVPASIAAILVLSISIVPILDKGDVIDDIETLSNEAESTSIDKGYDIGASQSDSQIKEPLQTEVSPDARMAAPSQATPPAASAPAAKPAQEKIITKKRKAQISTIEVTKPARNDIDNSRLSPEAEEKIRMKESDYSDVPMERQTTEAGVMDQPAPERRIQMAPQKSDSMLYHEKSDTSVLPPQEWLIKIKMLRKEGKTDEANNSLEEFRKHYPDYPIESILGTEQ